MGFLECHATFGRIYLDLCRGGLKVQGLVHPIIGLLDSNIDHGIPLFMFLTLLSVVSFPAIEYSWWPLAGFWRLLLPTANQC